MSSKRLATSVVNWAAIAERVPKHQADTFRSFKSNSERYVNRIVELPDELPKINFADYAKRISNKAMVAEFEKQYNALQVAYPKDLKNEAAKISAEAKEATEQMNVFIAEQKEQIVKCENVLAKMDSVPPPEEMTKQMKYYYFPEASINPNKANPSFWPQWKPIDQFDLRHKLSNRLYMINHAGEYTNLQTMEEAEKEWYEKMEAQDKLLLERQEADKLEAGKKEAPK